MHLTDAELLQFEDRELPPGRAAEVQRHLDTCWRCMARQAELQGGLAAFLQAHGAVYDPQVPAAKVPAARLLARMKQAPRPSPPRRSLWWGVAAIAAAMVAGVWWVERPHTNPLVPDARLTPGATLNLSRDQVCAVPEEDELRAVPASMAGQVFDRYRIRPTPRAYEVDYLIAPALGGATDVRNLWPQPYAEGVWNAGVKDALEDHLRHLVCRGVIDLATAQREIATDWIAAYRKYFRTDQPLTVHARYRKDQPWE